MEGLLWEMGTPADLVRSWETQFFSRWSCEHTLRAEGRGQSPAACSPQRLRPDTELLQALCKQTTLWSVQQLASPWSPLLFLCMMHSLCNWEFYARGRSSSKFVSHLQLAPRAVRLVPRVEQDGTARGQRDGISGWGTRGTARAWE